MLLLTSILISTGCGIWLGYQFYWVGTCGLSLFIVILTLVFTVFFYTAALIKLCNIQIFRRNATIFTVSLASVYIVYMSWTSIASNPDPQCNPFSKSTGNTALQIIIGVIFTLSTVMSIALASNEHSNRSQEITTSVGG